SKGMEPGLSQAKYVEHVNRLLTSLSSQPSIQLAVCVTKIHQLSARAKPVDYLDEFFGAGMRRTIEQFQKSKSFKIKFYAVTPTSGLSTMATKPRSRN